MKLEFRDEQNLTCDTCNKIFTLQIAYDKHLKNHKRINDDFFNIEKTENELFKYDKISNTSVRENQMIVKIEDQSEAFETLDLKEGIKNRRFDPIDESQKEQIHSEGNGFQCPTCNKRFKYQNPLIMHKRIHSGEKPFECKTCDAKFPSRSGLNRHEKIHSISKQTRIELIDHT